MLQTPYEILVTKPGAFKREFLFSKDDKTIGVITTSKSFRLETVSQSGNEYWKLSQSGWWRPYFHYVASHRPYTKGKFRPAWNGLLDFTAADGSRYTLEKLQWYSASSVWYKGKDQVLMIKPIHSFNSKRAKISVYRPDDTHLWLLITIAWHLYLINKRQATAAS